MNILFLATTLPYPLNTGYNLRTYNILKYSAQFNNIFLVAFIKNRKDRENADELRKFCRSVDVFVIPDDISKLRLIISLLMTLFSPLPYVAHKYYRREVRKKILDIIGDKRIDLVHFDLLHLARYHRQLESIPSFLIEHNVEFLRLKRLKENSKDYLYKLFIQSQYRKLYRFEKRVISDFDMCGAVSEIDRRCLEGINPKVQCVVLPNGVDTEYFAPRENIKIPNSLIWVGGMADIFNEEAITYFCEEIFPMISSQIPDVKIYIIGVSPPGILNQLAKENKNIEVLGYVNDIRPYMDGAMVYIAPIKSGGGTKLKILTAMAMGIPVITTSIGAEGIEAIDGVHLLVANGPEEFAERTVELLQNSEKGKKMGVLARELMLKKYDWNIIGKRQIEIYKNILESCKHQ